MGAWRRASLLCAVLAACGGEALIEVPPVTVARPAPRGAARVTPDAGVSETAEIERELLAGALGTAAPAPAVPLGVFGDGGVRPADAHAFRMAVSMKTARGNASGVKVLQLMSSLRSVARAREQIGLDPFADGEWLLAYGPRPDAPWPNVNVLKHGRAEGEVARAIGDAGMEAFDAGAGAVWSELFSVRDVLLRPQAGMLALVPSDRAGELATALKAPIDHGVKAGEMARVALAEPAKLVRFVPAGVVKAIVIVKPAADGGLDVGAEADCPGSDECKTTATELEELARRSNSLAVRFVTRNLLGSLAVRAEGKKLRATLHATPDQVEALVNLARAQLDVVPAP
ncbi:MAG: hypothetical protein KF819_11005 [Labilithrix sp.]|nr:hypothetical protein [Labilithrix sp.]